jgi:3-oxoacyl-[acyl-carrier protein] reductase
MFPHDHPLPLHGKTALVTGVSRRRGIGFAVASRLARLGASVFFHHFRPHDTDLPWGGDDLDALRAELRDALTPGAAFGDAEADLRDAAAIPGLVERARGLTGSLDILVCNHAQSGGDGSILDMTAERLDAFWSANARSSLLLTQAFAALHRLEAPAARPGERAGRAEPFAEPVGRVFWMTSGQIHGPMRGEVAYATSKAALAGVTKTVAAELLDLGIILNTIDPGPVNTGYLDPETTDRPLEEITDFVRSTPFGRFGAPDDPARLIAWLSTPDGAWVVGQVLSSDGGLGLG